MTLISLFLALHAYADIGPKPTMAFEFEPRHNINLSSLQLLQCEHADCKDAKPLQQVGPQHFSCSEEGCDALAYGFAEFNQLAGKNDEGKAIKSNVFKAKGMTSQYTVTIKGTKLEVKPKPGT